MSRLEKLREKILLGTSDTNISFDDLRYFLIALGFEERIRGSHHIYRMAGISDKPNLQRDGNKAKAYQVKQVRQMVEMNSL